MVDSSARRTIRLATVIEAVAFALGGEAGHRLLLTLGLTLSPDALLNVIRTTVLPLAPPPRVVGIDDSADDSDQAYKLIFSQVSSADSGYDGLDVDDASLINYDDEGGGGGGESEGGRGTKGGIIGEAF